MADTHRVHLLPVAKGWNFSSRKFEDSSHWWQPHAPLQCHYCYQWTGGQSHHQALKLSKAACASQSEGAFRGVIPWQKTRTMYRRQKPLSTIQSFLWILTLVIYYYKRRNISSGVSIVVWGHMCCSSTVRPPGIQLWYKAFSGWLRLFKIATTENRNLTTQGSWMRLFT